MAVAFVAAAAVLGGGGYFALGKLRCQALEDDYLNSVSEARQSILLRQLAPDSQAMAHVSAGLAETQVGAAEKLLPLIYQECGDGAGRTAFRKGTELILGEV